MMRSMLSIKNIIILVCIVVGLGWVVVQSQSEKAGSAQKVYKVGIIQQMEHHALDDSNKGFLAGLAAKGYKVGENLQIDQQNAQGDQANMRTIAQRFVAEKDDLIGAIATNAAQTVANTTKTIPVVGMAITDYEAAKLVKTNAKPGGNVTGMSNVTPPSKPVDLMLAILPHIKTVGAIYTSSEINSSVQYEAFKKYAESKGLVVKTATVSNVNEIQQATEMLLRQGVQAIYVPTDNVIASAYPNVMQLAHRAKVPVFPSEQNAMKAGGLAMYSVDYYELGYEAGLMAGAILNGESKPATTAVGTAKEYKLYINAEEAKQLGIVIPQAILEKATVVKPAA